MKGSMAITTGEFSPLDETTSVREYGVIDRLVNHDG